MLIELWRKVIATDYTSTNCAVCGNDFDRGSVFPVAFGDSGDELGEMCPVCLDYLNRRKADEEDPTRGDWPARDWPSLEILQESRRCYPAAMYANRDALAVAATDLDTEDEIYRKSVLWGMEREGERAK
jgi:hypothetical protein